MHSHTPLKPLCENFQHFAMNQSRTSYMHTATNTHLSKATAEDTHTGTREPTTEACSMPHTEFWIQRLSLYGAERASRTMSAGNE